MQVYGDMQFADFVVSQALQINSRCLQTIAPADPDGEPAAKRAGKLRRDVLRLLALWQMMRSSIGEADFQQARKRLRKALRLIGDEEDWVERAARALAPKADSKRAKALEKALAKAVTKVGASVEPTAPSRFEQLGALFQQESLFWRDDVTLRQARDVDLIEQGITRAYERARRRTQAYVERPGRRKRLRRARRWVGYCVDYLELLQPALSEETKTQAWHLQRLQANLEKQWLVARFMDSFETAAIKGKTRKRVQTLADERTDRLRSRSKKLLLGAFEPSSQAFTREAGKAVRRLELEQIKLLPIPDARGSASDGIQA